MGSLMAGWDSPVRDPKLVKFKRNKSLTKEEIEAYWKSKKQKEQEHLRDISLISPRTQEKTIFDETAQRRNDRGSAEKKFLGLESDENLEKIIQKHGWWISSNWAFLNEPPVLAEGTKQKYASQFHVANMPDSGTSQGPTGISA